LKDTLCVYADGQTNSPSDGLNSDHYSVFCSNFQCQSCTVVTCCPTTKKVFCEIYNNFEFSSF